MTQLTSSILIRFLQIQKEHIDTSDWPHKTDRWLVNWELHYIHPQNLT